MAVRLLKICIFYSKYRKGETDMKEDEGSERGFLAVKKNLWNLFKSSQLKTGEKQTGQI